MDKKKLYVIIGAFLTLLTVVLVLFYLTGNKEKGISEKEPIEKENPIEVVDKDKDKGTSLGGNVGENNEEVNDEEGNEEEGNEELTEGNNGEVTEVDKEGNNEEINNENGNTSVGKVENTYDKETDKTTVSNGSISIVVSGKGNSKDKPNENKNVNVDKSTSKKDDNNKLPTNLPTPSGKTNVVVPKDAKEVFSSELLKGYTVKDVPSGIVAYDGAVDGSNMVFSYNKFEGSNTFGIWDISNQSIAYKILSELGFPLSEEEFNSSVNKSVKDSEAVEIGNVYIFHGGSNITVSW